MSRKPEIPIADRPTLTVDETTALIGVSRATVYKLLNSGQLASVMIGGRRLFPREAIDALIKASADERKAAAA